MGRDKKWYRKQRTQSLYVQPMDVNWGGWNAVGFGVAGQRGDKGEKLEKL